MPKKAYLAPHLEFAELEERYRTSSDPVEERRWYLLWQVCAGCGIKQTAISIGINYDYAKDIVRRYNKEGASGVSNRRKNRQRRGGREALLTPQQQEKLRSVLQHKPPEGGPWSGPKVARWIEQETGREKVWNQRGWDYLQRLASSS